MLQKLALLISSFVFLVGSAFAQPTFNYTNAPLNVVSSDSVVSIYPWKIIFDTGSVYKNGDNSAYISVASGSIVSTTYLKLDTSNDPLTGNLEISKVAPEYRLTDTGDSEYARWTRTTTNKEVDHKARVDTAGGADIGTNLIVHYLMNDNAATQVVLDNKGIQNGTSARNTSLMSVAGKINTALSFNGTSDTIDITGLTITGAARTVTWWAKNGAFVNAYEMLLDSATNRFLVAMEAAETTGHIGVYDGTWKSTGMHNSTDNLWHHYALVFSGDKVDCYKDGASTGGIASGYTLYDFTGTAAIGTFYDPIFQGFYSGSFDDIRIYTSALSSSQITAIYNSGSGTESEGTTAVTTEETYLSAKNGTAGTESSTVQLGADASRTIIDGTNIRFWNDGVEEATVVAGNWDFTSHSLTTTGTGTFGQIIDSGLTGSLGVYTDGSKQLTSTPPTSGILGYWSRTGTTLTQSNANDAIDLGSGTLTTTGTITGENITANGDLTIGNSTTEKIDWASGNVIYVPIGGDIATYITNATAGDTLVLAAGTYTITAGITVNKLLHIMGQGAGITTIACATDNVDMITMASAGAVISDMTISKSGAMTTTLKYQIIATANCNIDNIEFLNTCTGGAIYSSGVGCQTAGRIVNIENCTYSATGAIGNHPFIVNRTAAATINVRNCYASESGQTAANVILNLCSINGGIHNLYNSIFTSSSDVAVGTICTSAGNVNAYNCSINGSGATAFDVSRAAGTLTLYNTVLVGNKTSGVITYAGTVASSAYAVGAPTGVKLSAASGVLTLAGQGNTNNENLTLDFESVADNVLVNTGTGVVGIAFPDNFYLKYGTGYDVLMGWETTGNDSFKIGTVCGSATDSGYISIMEKADMTSANRSPLATSVDPVLRIYSSDATSATDYIEFFHNQTDAYIQSGTGTINFNDDNLTTTGIVSLLSDTNDYVVGAGSDMSIGYDGTYGQINTSLVSASDLRLTCGANKTLELQNNVYEDIQFPIASGKVPAANFPTWETFTTNTAAYAFSVNDLIDLQADEVFHRWAEGTAGNLHLHFAIKTAQSTGSDKFAKFTIWIAISDPTVGSGREVWTEVGPNSAEYTIPTGSSALQGFLLDMGDITLTNYKIGSQIKLRVKRIASTGGGGTNEYGDDVYITQVGIHSQVNTLGSRQETVK